MKGLSHRIEDCRKLEEMKACYVAVSLACTPHQGTTDDEAEALNA